MKYKQQAFKDQQPSMNVDGVAAWLGDTFISANPTQHKDKPMCAGFFHLEAGKALDYTYDYEEMKIVVEGEFNLTEGETADYRTRVVVRRPEKAEDFNGTVVLEWLCNVALR